MSRNQQTFTRKRMENFEAHEKQVGAGIWKNYCAMLSVLDSVHTKISLVFMSLGFLDTQEYHEVKWPISSPPKCYLERLS